MAADIAADCMAADIPEADHMPEAVHTPVAAHRLVTAHNLEVVLEIAAPGAVADHMFAAVGHMLAIVGHMLVVVGHSSGSVAHTLVPAVNLDVHTFADHIPAV